MSNLANPQKADVIPARITDGQMNTASFLRSNRIFLLFIVFGIILRLIWVNDMEWKGDEQWMYNTAIHNAATGHWDGIGMVSGGGIVNPGLSSAIFTAMAYMVHTPIGMATFVQWINVLSLLGFLLFIILKVETTQRETWLWGLSLAAISPLAVLFSRKIWAQDVLPAFSFMIVLFHANRKKGWGAFLWGFFGALVGQVHMSGFFYVAGLAIFTIIYDYRNKQPFKWAYWIAGSALGSIGLIPWLIFTFTQHQPAKLSLEHLYQMNFYIYWLLDSHGLNTMYSLRKDFWDFVKEPFIAGYPTYLIGALNILLASSGIYTLKRLWGYIKEMRDMIKQKQLFTTLTHNLSSVNFYLLSILLGLGIMMNFSGIMVCQHYLIVAFPFSYIFMAKIFRNKRKLFTYILCAQFILTASFMLYIHTHKGAKDGDYGVTYRAQMEAGKGH